MSKIKEINSFDVLSEDKIKLYIYLIINEIEGKVYIGKTESSIIERWRVHKSRAKKIKKLRDNGKKIHAEHFTNALVKHGFRIWKIYEIDIAYTIEDLNEKEIYWIAYFRKTLGRKKVYNIHRGGNGGVRWKNDGVKEFMLKVTRKTMIENWKNEEFKEIMQKLLEERWKNDEFKEFMRKSLKERWKNDEFKEFMRKVTRKTMIENWKNDEFKETRRKAISKGLIKKWQDNEFKETRRKEVTKKWQELKDRYSKNGVFLQDPIKNKEFAQDVQEMTMNQLMKKYKKAYDTIRKNITFFFGSGSLKDIRKYLKEKPNN